MNHPRRSLLKWLAALPFVGVMIPQAQAAEIEYAIITSNDPAMDTATAPLPFNTMVLDNGLLRQLIALRAARQLRPGLWEIRQDNPKSPEMDLITTVDGGIDLLVAHRWVAQMLERPEYLYGYWNKRHPLFTFAEIEDGHTFKEQFYPRLRRIQMKG